MARTDEQPTDQHAESRAVARVRAALAANGIAHPRIREFDASTATAADAANAIGTTEARIVKSLVFMAADQPVLVLASGTNRVDLSKLSALVGAKTRRADADEVRQATGYAIGGVPPLAHANPIQTFVDEDLLQFDEVWAAAGTPNSVFPIAPRSLVQFTSGTVAGVAQSA
jgi:Cys-tRNA(Pro) deacylase